MKSDLKFLFNVHFRITKRSLTLHEDSYLTDWYEFEQNVLLHVNNCISMHERLHFVAFSTSVINVFNKKNQTRRHVSCVKCESVVCRMVE